MGSLSRGLLGIGADAIAIDIECHISNNLPTIMIVGSAGKAIMEARDRLRGAFASSKLELPRRRITINLAPAEIPKNDSSLDLAMALGILTADGKLDALPANQVAIGELGLDGSVKPLRGIIGKLLNGNSLGFNEFFIPAANLGQAQLIPNITLYPVHSLGELYRHMTHTEAIAAIQTGNGIINESTKTDSSDLLEDVTGQAQAKRALVIAAAGGHNVLLSGPPGTGKSMLAKALCSLLPPPSRAEMLEITHLSSLANHTYDKLITSRPLRQPHHSASHTSIIGSGGLKPGEISLSHRGVLLLDEFPEFNRQVIESLRQPLEDRTITITRARDSAQFPANFILMATANPCPCGFADSGVTQCSCSQAALTSYRARLSGPILDRIDLRCDVQLVNHSQLLAEPVHTSTAAAKKLILQARGRQAERYGSALLNSDLTNRTLRKHAKLSPKARTFIDTTASKINLSARAYVRTVKVARTIADLQDSTMISIEHITEALSYRHRTA